MGGPDERLLRNLQAHEALRRSVELGFPQRFVRLRPLGQGGMGSVLLAWDSELRREVALKQLHARVPSLAQRTRFEREARALATLNHPGVVRIHAVLSEGPHQLLVLDYVDGESLANRLARGPLPIAEACSIARQVAAALVHAHARGVLHRDLKPGNVLLSQDGRAMLTDFGLAKLTESVSSLTHSGQILGTLGYLAPEQLTDAKRVTAAADLYGLGATLFAMLTGRPPLEGDTLMAQVAATLDAVPPPPSSLRGEVPIALDAICARCLAKRPSDRYSDAAALEQALEELPAPSRFRWAPWLVGAALLGGAFGAFLLPGSRPTPEPASYGSPQVAPAQPERSDERARRAVLAHVLARDVNGASLALTSLGGTAVYAALGRLVDLEGSRLAAVRRTQFDEAQLFVLTPAERAGFVDEALRLLREFDRLDRAALADFEVDLLGLYLDTAAELLLAARGSGKPRPILGEAAAERLQRGCAQAPGTLGAAKLAMMLALEGPAQREAWAAAQPAEAPRGLSTEWHLLRAYFLLSEWHAARPAAAIRVGEAALAELPPGGPGVRLAPFVRALRQDLSAAYLSEALPQLRVQGPRPTTLGLVASAYRLAYGSFSRSPLTAPPWDTANTELEIPLRGRGDLDLKTLVYLFVALVIGGHHQAADRVVAACDDAADQAVLQAELALIREGPAAALEVLAGHALRTQEGAGIRAHALALLGRHAEAASQLRRASGLGSLGLPWHDGGDWCRALVAGNAEWWPGEAQALDSAHDPAGQRR